MPASNARARALARRLIALEESRPRKSPESVEAAPLEACYQLHLSLCRFVGAIGCETLSARALKTAEADHPVLRGLTVRAGDRPYFDGVHQAIRIHDAAMLAAGLEAFLTSLLELLTRFVGEEIVVAMTERTLHSENGDEPIRGDRT